MRYWVFTAVLVGSVMGFAACDWLGTNEDRIIEGDWDLERPERTEVAPGELLELHLTGVDADLGELQVWADDLPDPLPPRDVLDGEIADDGDVRVRVHAPFLRAGVHTIRLGAADMVRTGALELTVVVPVPQLSKAEMASVLRRSAENITANVRALLEDPDPTWQQAMAESLGTMNLATALELMVALGEVGATIEQDYLAVPDEDEPALQALFASTGLLPALEEMAAIDLAASARFRHAQTLLDRLPHIPARLLYQLDLASLGISITNDALAIVNVIALFVPGGQPLALGGAELWMVIHAVRFIVDAMIPTDLYELDTVMTQPVVYEGIAHRWYYWGTFQPENRNAGVITSFDNLIASVLSEIAGKKLGGRILEHTKDLVSSIVAKVGLRIPALFDSLAPTNVPTIKLVVNMQAYSLTAGDLALLIPFMGPALKLTSALTIDFELVSPISLAAGIPTFAAGARPNLDYATDTFSVAPLAWPTGEREAALRIDASGFRFTTKEVFVASLPKLETTTIDRTITLFKDADPLDPNETPQDHALLLTRLPTTTGGEHIEYVDRGTLAQVPVTLSLHELAGGRPDTVRVDVLVNGALQHGDVEVTDLTDLSLALLLERGRNTVRVLAKAGHALGYQTSAGSVPVALEAGFPQAVQLDTTRGVYLQIGSYRDFTIVTSPPKE